MSADPFVIAFPNASAAEANQYATDLALAISDLDPEIVLEKRRLRPDSQDFGASLAVILGTASATAIAKGIASWLMRHSGARIEIRKDGTVVASNLDSRDAARIAQAFSGSPR